MSEVAGRAHYNARGIRSLELANKTKDPERAEIYNQMAKSYFELAELSPDDCKPQSSPEERTGEGK